MSHGLPIGVWLTPCKADAAWLDPLINRLSADHGTPPFAAHVSLHVGRVADEAQARDILDRVAARHAPLTLTAGATGHGAARFRAVYIDLPTGPLRDIAAALALRIEPDPAFSLDAHLSLIYAELPPAVRVALADGNDHRGRRLHFDDIVAVAPAAGENDFDNVPGWRIVARAPLRGL
ncbi:MAG: hypothetical protein R3E87_17030 [Burkholderiaceae bacterium]